MRELFNKVGFGWATRILALVMLVALLVSLAALRHHTRTKKHGPLFKATFLRDTPYTLFILGQSLPHDCLVLKITNLSSIRLHGRRSICSVLLHTELCA
jgi:hypothetical protein